MTIIKTEMNTQEFLRCYGNDSLLRNFSRGAIGIVLGRIAHDQAANGVNDTNSNWRKVFVDLREVNAENLLLNPEFGLSAHASAVLEMTRNYEGINAETAERLRSQSKHTDIIVLHSNLSELQQTKGWEEAAADLISSIKGYERMPNDKYLVHLTPRATTV